MRGMMRRRCYVDGRVCGEVYDEVGIYDKKEGCIVRCVHIVRCHSYWRCCILLLLK